MNKLAALAFIVLLLVFAGAGLRVVFPSITPRDLEAGLVVPVFLMAAAFSLIGVGYLLMHWLLK
jgi:hypothetical protein